MVYTAYYIVEFSLLVYTLADLGNLQAAMSHPLSWPNRTCTV